MARKAGGETVIVLFGEEEFQKAEALRAALDRLLPPDVDRGLALAEYDGSKSEEQGGPSLAAVLDDLCTLPFLADRRVVAVRDADRFVSAHRERLESYVERASPTGTLVLTCRSFPKTTRLYKAIAAAGGALVECKKLNARGLADFAMQEAAERGKRLPPQVAARLVELVAEQGALRGEVEKLSLYVAQRDEITAEDVNALVGQSREEKIFAVLDAAGMGQPRRAIELWQQLLDSDPGAQFRALGGMTFSLRRWLDAAREYAAGQPARQLAPKLMMWGRERELEQILRRMSPRRLRGALAALADVDAQAKIGLRSIETGIEHVLLRLGSG